MATCPYCSDVILHQIRHHEVLWFCRRCWAEIPEAVVQQTMLSDRLPTPPKPLPAKHRLVVLSSQRSVTTHQAA